MTSTLTAPVAQTRPRCRTCPHEPFLVPVHDLGTIALSDFITPKTWIACDTAPLAVGVCPTCCVVQLLHTVSRDRLFRRYWYHSGINEAMVAELRHVVRSAVERVAPTQDEIVLDLGANDGTLLAEYKRALGQHHPLRVAYEPAQNLYDQLSQHAELVYGEFFPPAVHADLTHLQRRGVGRCRIVTSIAMFYAQDDPNAFVHAVKQVLAPEGVWIVQLQDLLQMWTRCAFDNYCHEHLQYYSLFSLQRVLAHNQLTVYDVEERDINGGSLRCYIGHGGRTRPSWATADGTEHVLTQIEMEQAGGLCDPDEIKLRGHRLERRIARIREQVQAAIASVHTVDGYGASTKGNTLLPVLGLDKTHIRQIAERTPEKVGRLTVKTRIPIVAEETWRADPAPLTLVPIWGFRAGILQREAQYLQQGGSFLFPLPSVEVVHG